MRRLRRPRSSSMARQCVHRRWERRRRARQQRRARSRSPWRRRRPPHASSCPPIPRRPSADALGQPIGDTTSRCATATGSSLGRSTRAPRSRGGATEYESRVDCAFDALWARARRGSRPRDRASTVRARAARASMSSTRSSGSATRWPKHVRAHRRRSGADRPPHSPARDAGDRARLVAPADATDAQVSRARRRRRARGANWWHSRGARARVRALLHDARAVRASSSSRSTSPSCDWKRPGSSNASLASEITFPRSSGTGSAKHRRLFPSSRPSGSLLPPPCRRRSAPRGFWIGTTAGEL